MFEYWLESCQMRMKTMLQLWCLWTDTDVQILFRCWIENLYLTVDVYLLLFFTTNCFCFQSNKGYFNQDNGLDYILQLYGWYVWQKSSGFAYLLDELQPRMISSYKIERYLDGCLPHRVVGMESSEESWMLLNAWTWTWIFKIMISSPLTNCNKTLNDAVIFDTEKIELSFL